MVFGVRFHMLRFVKILAVLVIPALALGACETPVRVQSLPGLTYSHLGPLKLNVAKIEIVTQYRPPLTRPNVDHLFPTPPLKAIRQWASDRLRAVGRAGVARVVIRQAAAIETALAQKKGIKAAFTKQQAFRYDLTLDATVEIHSRPGGGDASAQATRFTTLGEDASVNERNRVWLKLTETLMLDFNAEMEKNLGRFLVR